MAASLIEYTEKYEIWCSKGGEYINGGLLGCKAVWACL
jgi:hypothetical protein